MLKDVDEMGTPSAPPIMEVNTQIEPNKNEICSPRVSQRSDISKEGLVEPQCVEEGEPKERYYYITASSI